MLTPFDDYPIHQTALPVAHPASGDPNHYDRYWFNGYTEEHYFAVAMAVYPNRGIIDAAFAVVHDGVQRSVFASGRIPADRAETRIGPIRIEVVEPLRVNRVLVDAPEHGLRAELTYRARSVTVEEPRQTITNGVTLTMDSTRLTQWGTWDGTIESGSAPIAVRATRGTKDRSWGIRPVGPQVAGAPSRALPEICFLWAPLHFDDCCTHFMVFERANGHRFVESAAVIPLLAGPDDATWGPDLGIEQLLGGDHHVRWAPGLRRSEGATIHLDRADATRETIELEPLLTFRMRGLGYTHPQWGHGVWHDELAVGGEEHPVEALDNLEPWNIHVQQVMRARWGERSGLGVLEQLVFGPHRPSGLTGLLDGFAG